MKANAYVFADGSSSSKGDIGAWSAIVATPDKVHKVLYGCCYPTTISRCELTPIVEGLRWIASNLSSNSSFCVVVCSDSEYTVKTLCGIQARHKNTDLWAAVDEVSKQLTVKYIWRERNTLPYMELCDWLCTALRKQMYEVARKWVGEGNEKDMEKYIPRVKLPETCEEFLAADKVSV